MELRVGNTGQVFSFVCVVFVLHNSVLGNATNNKCEGSLYNCCQGYKYNAALNTCTECEVGYFKENCSSKCPYNTYGRNCQLICDCLEDRCHFEQGCIEDRSGNKTTERPRRDVHKQSDMTMYSIMKTSMTWLVFLFIFFIIANLALFGIQKLTVRRRNRPSLDVENGENDFDGKDQDK